MIQWWIIVSPKRPELHADHYSSVTTLVLPGVNTVCVVVLEELHEVVMFQEMEQEEKK